MRMRQTIFFFSLLAIFSLCGCKRVISDSPTHARMVHSYEALSSMYERDVSAFIEYEDRYSRADNLEFVLAGLEGLTDQGVCKAGVANKHLILQLNDENDSGKDPIMKEIVLEGHSETADSLSTLTTRALTKAGLPTTFQIKEIPLIGGQLLDKTGAFLRLPTHYFGEDFLAVSVIKVWRSSANEQCRVSQTSTTFYKGDHLFYLYAIAPIDEFEWTRSISQAFIETNL